MVRKCNTRRGALQRGHQRGSKVKRFNHSFGRGISFLRKFSNSYNLPQITASSFDLICRWCAILYLVPFEKKPDGTYGLQSTRRLVGFWFSKFVTGCILIYRVWITAKYCIIEDITATSLLTLVQTLTLFDYWLIGFWDPAETVAVLNKLYMMFELLQNKSGREFHIFGDIRLCFKTIAVMLMIPAVTFSIAIVNGLLFGSLPTSWLRLAESYGDLPWMDRIWWQLIFLPLEIISVLPPVTAASVVCMIALMSMGSLVIVGEEIRSMEFLNLDSRAEVERMYICWQLSCYLARSWCKLHITPIIGGISCAIVIYIFVAIKYTSLPLLVYLIFPVAGVVQLTLLMLGVYDAVVANDLSEQVRAQKLMSFEAEELKAVPRIPRKDLGRRVKALMPISVPVGPFTDIRFNLMVTILEEIMNQVVFLLSF